MTNQAQPTLRYYLPGQIFLLMEYEAALSAAGLSEILLSQPALQDIPELTDAFTTLPDTLNTDGTKVLLAFDRQQFSNESPAANTPAANIGDRPNYFAALFLELRDTASGSTVSDARLLEIMQTVEQRLSGTRQSLIQYSSANGEAELDIPPAKQDAMRGIPPEPVRDAFTLIGMSYNWFSAAAQTQIITGGPGSIPVPYVDNGQLAYGFQFPSLDLGEGNGEGVRVAILDTALDAAALNAAFSKPEYSGQTLLQSFNGTGVLDIHPSTTQYNGAPIMPQLEDHNSPLGTAIGAHHYNAVDHGLFIAGQIHSIAPQAKLELVQVLSSYGVGTLQTGVDGFQALLNQFPLQKLVVNCSFMLTIPLSDYPTQGTPPEQAVIEANLGILATTAILFTFIGNLFTSNGAVLVAAAGNDGANSIHPPAQLPAATLPFYGVGAMDSPTTLSSYSNRGDILPTEGFITFGGAEDSNGFAVTPQSASSAPYGVLGIFTQDFPDGMGGTLANNNGWGWWAGTSFAAPVIAGVMACLGSNGITPQQVLIALQGSYTATPEQEQVVEAMQV